MKTGNAFLTMGGIGLASAGIAITSLPIAVAGLGIGTVAALLDIPLGKQKNIDFILKRCKVKLVDENNNEHIPNAIAHETNALGEKFIYGLPVGMSINDLTKKKDEIEQALGKTIEITKEGNSIAVQTLENTLESSYPLDLKKSKGKELKFIIGRNIAKEEVYLDLSGNDTHTLVVGTTGSGKSVALDLLITQFILFDLEIALVDMKAVTFVGYSRYRNLKGFAIDELNALKVINDTLTEMNRRYQLLLENGCKDYKSYNQKCVGNAITPRILVIDEFQSLLDDKETKKLLFMLLSKARAANIIVILSCQSPRAEIVDGRLRDNIKNYLIFRCENKIASGVATGEVGNGSAAALRGKGHGLFKNQGEYTEFQGYMLEDEAIEKLISSRNGSINHAIITQEETVAEPQPKKRGRKKVNKQEVLEKVEQL